MNRMTLRTKDGKASILNSYVVDVDDLSDIVEMLCERLAAYEDIGLSPDEILNLVNRDKTIYKKIFNVVNIEQRSEIYDSPDFEQRIKILLILLGKTQAELCKQFGMSQANFLARCRTGKFSFDEQNKIASILGCKLIVKFVFEDRYECIGRTAKDVIVKACKHAQTSQSELAERLGKSKQALNSKLKNGRFTDKELSKVPRRLDVAMSTILSWKTVHMFEMAKSQKELDSMLKGRKRFAE